MRVQSFDSFSKQIDENESILSDTKFLKEILEYLIYSNEKFLSDPTILIHRLFVILRAYYLTSLTLSIPISILYFFRSLCHLVDDMRD